jgi:hypothetical protein
MLKSAQKTYEVRLGQRLTANPCNEFLRATSHEGVTQDNGVLGLLIWIDMSAHLCNFLESSLKLMMKREDQAPKASPSVFVVGQSAARPPRILNSATAGTGTRENQNVKQACSWSPNLFKPLYKFVSANHLQIITT